MTPSLPVVYGADPDSCGWSVDPRDWCVTQQALETVSTATSSVTQATADTSLSMGLAIRAQQALAVAGDGLSSVDEINPGIMGMASSNATGVWGRAAYWTAVGSRLVSGSRRAALLALSESLFQRMMAVASWDNTIGAVPVVNILTGARQTTAYPGILTALAALRAAGAEEAAQVLAGVTRGVWYSWVVQKTGQAVVLAGVGALAYMWFIGIAPSEVLSLARRR